MYPRGQTGALLLVSLIVRPVLPWEWARCRGLLLSFGQSCCHEVLGLPPNARRQVSCVLLDLFADPARTAWSEKPRTWEACMFAEVAKPPKGDSQKFG